VTGSFLPQPQLGPPPLAHAAWGAVLGQRFLNTAITAAQLPPPPRPVSAADLIAAHSAFPTATWAPAGGAPRTLPIVSGGGGPGPQKRTLGEGPDPEETWFPKPPEVGWNGPGPDGGPLPTDRWKEFWDAVNAAHERADHYLSEWGESSDPAYEYKKALSMNSAIQAGKVHVTPDELSKFQRWLQGLEWNQIRHRPI
jgi:hypothetical protein